MVVGQHQAKNSSKDDRDTAPDRGVQHHQVQAQRPEKGLDEWYFHRDLQWRVHRVGAHSTSLPIEPLRLGAY